jgi:hypothetical protein
MVRLLQIPVRDQPGRFEKKQKPPQKAKRRSLQKKSALI